MSRDLAKDGRRGCSLDRRRTVVGGRFCFGDFNEYLTAINIFFDGDISRNGKQRSRRVEGPRHVSHIGNRKNERMAALLNIFRQNVSRLVLTFCRGRDSGDGGGELIKLGL